MLKLLITLSLVLVACSGQDKLQVEAEGRAIDLVTPKVSTKNFSSSPDALTVFFWPTEEFFKRYSRQGLIKAVDYEAYIADTSKVVIVNGDAFDDTLVQMDNKSKEGAQIENQIAQLEAQINKALGRQPVDEANINRWRSELKKQERRYERYQDELFELYAEVPIKQGAALGAIQKVLDPQAVVYEAGGDFDVEATRQVNWYPVYTDAADDYNVFNFNTASGVVHIELGEWGPDAQSYKTKYIAGPKSKPKTKAAASADTNANAEASSSVGGVDKAELKAGPVLAPDSDIQKLSLSPEGVLKFEFMEKNSRGNLTGRRYEFELQLSYFASMLRVMGDVRYMYEDQALRHGQLKALFSADE